MCDNKKNSKQKIKRQYCVGILCLFLYSLLDINADAFNKAAKDVFFPYESFTKGVFRGFIKWERKVI